MAIKAPSNISEIVNGHFKKFGYAYNFIQIWRFIVAYENLVRATEHIGIETVQVVHKYVVLLCIK